MDGYELLQIQAGTLFTYDERGRTVLDNYPGGGAAPRLFAGRSLGGDVSRFGASVPEPLVNALTAVLAQEPRATELRSPFGCAAELARQLEAHGHVEASGGGPTYHFAQPPAVPAGVERITAENAGLVRDGFPVLFQTIDRVPHCYAVLRDGAAVSVCFSSRTGPRGVEAEVETLPDYRGHGFAAAVTAAWAAAVQGAGKVPLYTTSWENVASQGVARTLGLIQYASDWWWV